MEGVNAAVREIVNAAFRGRCQYHWPDVHTQNLHEITVEVEPEALYMPLTPNVSIMSPPSTSAFTNPEPPPPKPVVQSVWRRFYDLRSNPNPRFARISFPSSSATTLDGAPAASSQMPSTGTETPPITSAHAASHQVPSASTEPPLTTSSPPPAPAAPADAPLPSSTDTALAASTFVVAERMKVVYWHFRKMKGLLFKARSEREAEEARRGAAEHTGFLQLGA
ncbi:hypothetical protein HK097_011122 [Rhizophlyctis rosea]|uniref:Uncharacterized protein n=1 Tax=Rhizophlyctis rosea TaxID=64517 RepID=A0AAD5SID7_9FUNG|nr:hypothetical protein HK097_011122 [Rhizophlyctis rosea]